MKCHPELLAMLDKAGREAEDFRQNSRRKIKNEQDLNEFASTSEGVYWVETNMPENEIISAVKEYANKDLKVRKTKPEGKGFTSPGANGFRVVYVGTQNNIKERLAEHLFDAGSKGTGKLRCRIDREPFSMYEWYFSQCLISSYSIRYAVEAWWRLNVGWPPFCIR